MEKLLIDADGRRGTNLEPHRAGESRVADGTPSEHRRIGNEWVMYYRRFDALYYIIQ